MSLYAIGDLHLSQTADKPMDVFGGRWQNYIEKLERGFAALSGSDVCVICGDLSWAADLPSAVEDFRFLSRLPGKKLVLKGNHDYWWSTASKARRVLGEAGIEGVDFLHNNCFFYEGAAVCGTRGWFYEEEQGGEHDKKIMLRELGRLETSLKAAGDAEKYVFLHYPPKYGAYICREITDMLSAYGVKMCCAGHIHGRGLATVFEGEFGGVRYKQVSADHIGFTPVKIL